LLILSVYFEKLSDLKINVGIRSSLSRYSGLIGNVLQVIKYKIVLLVINKNYKKIFFKIKLFIEFLNLNIK